MTARTGRSSALEKDAAYWADVEALAATAPPLTADQRDRLAVLLRPGAEIALPAERSERAA